MRVEPASQGVPPSGTGAAIAHPNIALIKYWGKVDGELNIPANSSLSLTLDVAPTRTEVTLDPQLDGDVAELNGEQLQGTPMRRIAAFLDLIRRRTGSEVPAQVRTTNEIPTGAGLASSAAGFAALAVAGSVAYGLDLAPRDLSRLARRGSGSASRSIFGGLVKWNRGTDDGSSYAEPIDAPELDLQLLVVLSHREPKAISSRDAMNRTAQTSPYYRAWVESTEVQLGELEAAITAADIGSIGEIVESNALRMHASMLGARPPIRYWTSTTLMVLDRIQQLRAEGLDVFATMDAGPNVKLLVRGAHVPEVLRALGELLGGTEVLASGFGPGAASVDRA